MLRFHSVIYTGPTLITAFRKLTFLPSLNIRNYYHYFISLHVGIDFVELFQAKSSNV